MTSPAQQWHSEHQQQHEVGKKPKITKLGIIVTAVFLVGIGVMFYFIATTTPDVGECASVREKSGRAEYAQTDCGKPEAIYLVGATDTGKSPKCPAGDYKQVRDNGSRKSSSDSMTCYLLNVKQGDCVKAKKLAKDTVSERVPCGQAELKVAKVVDGKADDTLCSGGVEAFTYSKPAKTICMEKP